MFYKLAAVFTLSGFALLFSCSPQTSSGEKERIRNKNSESVGDNGGQVGIDDGSNLQIPPGALAIGSEITVQKVADDEAFAVGGESASDTVEFSGSGPDGAPLEQAAQPMTVALSINSGASLMLTGSVDDMCVMLKTISGKKMIWRRTLLTIDEVAKKVSLQSLYFGKYKAVYCGAAAIAGFEDAGDTGATGGTPLTISMTIPKDLFAAVDHGRYCFGLAREKEDDSCKSNNNNNDTSCNEEITMIANSEAFRGTSDVEMTLSVNPGSLIEGYSYIVGLSLLDKTGECVMTVGKDLKKTGPGDAKAFYAFVVDADQIKSGLSGTIGAGEPFNLVSFGLKIGGGSIAGLTPHDEAQVCIDVDGEKGKTLTLVSFAGGKINGQSEARILAASPSGGQIDKLRMYVGARCNSFDIDFTKVDTATGKPYEFAAPVAPGVTVTATPVTLGISTTNPLLAGKNACLKVLVPDGADSIESDRLGRSMINFSQTGYKIYLPFLTDTKYQNAAGTPKYDMEITALVAGGHCDNSSEASKRFLPPVPLKGKVLTATISVNL